MSGMTEDGGDSGGDGRDEALLQAVERFALQLTDAGMPRMPARIFAYLIIDDADDATAGELVDRLRVSPAAVSGGLRYLVQAGLLVRERRPGARRDHYRLHNDIWYETYLQRIDVLRRWEDLLSETIDAVGPDKAPASLLETREFMAFVRDEYPGMMERWRAHRRTLD